jgi:hypothetical protein
MTLPVSLILLGIIALVLHLLFGYLIPSPPVEPPSRWYRPGVAIVVIIVVLLLWYVLPLRIGG